MLRSSNQVSRGLDDLGIRPLTWGYTVSEGGLEPALAWYITETVIHHHSKLAQPRAARAGISPPRGGGRPSRLRSPGA